jgi:hypothetical protein
MNEPRHIDVVYADGHWLAQTAPETEFDCGNLMELIGR